MLGQPSVSQLHTFVQATALDIAHSACAIVGDIA